MLTAARHTLLTLLFSACLLPGLVNQAHAQSSYDLGVEAYRAEDYEQARVYWETAANEGNVSATFNLGLLLSKGLGGEADPERAVSLFRRVAESGLAIGQHNLALAYYTGKGVSKNNAQARIWWERAARQGHTQAQFNLAALLWNGDGVAKDANEAVKWFREASDAGHLQARAFLDSIFEEANLHSTPDPVDTPDSDPDPALSALLQQAALAYRQQDYQQAFILWEQAAQRGNAIAQYQLARLYREGLGVEQDASRAFQYTEQSALQNLPEAQYRMAMYYLEGIQVEKNETLALYWMQSAADQGHIQATDYLERAR